MIISSLTKQNDFGRTRSAPPVRDEPEQEPEIEINLQQTNKARQLIFGDKVLTPDMWEDDSDLESSDVNEDTETEKIKKTEDIIDEECEKLIEKVKVDEKIADEIEEIVKKVEGIKLNDKDSELKEKYNLPADYEIEEGEILCEKIDSIDEINEIKEKRRLESYQKTIENRLKDITEKQKEREKQKEVTKPAVEAKKEKPGVYVVSMENISKISGFMIQPKRQQVPVEKKVESDSSVIVPPSFNLRAYNIKGSVLTYNKIKRRTVDEILNCKTRLAILLNIEKTIFKQGFVKKPSQPKMAPPAAHVVSKTLDNIAIFRKELNNVTKANIANVLKTIKNLKIKKNKEIHEMCKILYEKTIMEINYFPVHISIIKALYETLKSEEEKNGKDKHTEFFKYLCSMAKNAFINRQKWSHNMENTNKTMSLKERMDYENEYEEKECVKIMTKARTLGNVKLLGALYCNAVIKETIINFMIKDLLKNLNDEENMEILVNLIECIGEKLSKVNIKQFDEIYKTLKNFKSNDTRIMFRILDALPKCEGWKAEKISTSGINYSNRFEGIKLDAGDDNNDLNSTSNEPKKFDLPSQLKNIMADIVNPDCSREMILQNINKCFDKVTHNEFYDSFIEKTIEDFGGVTPKTEILILSIGNNSVLLPAILKENFENLPELVYDAPHCYIQFYKIISLLRMNDLISEEVFNSFKSDTREEKMEKVISDLLMEEKVEKIEKISDLQKIKCILRKATESGNSQRFKKAIEMFGTD